MNSKSFMLSTVFVAMVALGCAKSKNADPEPKEIAMLRSLTQAHAQDHNPSLCNGFEGKFSSPSDADNIQLSISPNDSSIEQLSPGTKDFLFTNGKSLILDGNAHMYGDSETLTIALCLHQDGHENAEILIESYGASGSFKGRTIISHRSDQNINLEYQQASSIPANIRLLRQ